MGKDNQPKDRQKAHDLRRRAAIRQAFQRILIVSEGSKTEPQYLNEIRTELRLTTAHVQVQPGGFGTEPLQLVEYAEHLFVNGNRMQCIEPRAFDQVFVVFDRDDHATYHAALHKAAALNCRLTNDERKRVPVVAVPSVPCFELWLLLHFVDVQAPIGRNQVYARLSQHLPGYAKGQGGHWAATKEHLDVASRRAAARAQATSSYNGNEPFTNMHCLVDLLVHLRD